jgi:hypothetical protein
MDSFLQVFQAKLCMHFSSLQGMINNLGKNILLLFLLKEGRKEGRKERKEGRKKASKCYYTFFAAR